MHLIIIFPPAVHDVQVNVHRRPTSLLKRIFHWIHTTVKLTDVVGVGGPHEFFGCTFWKNSIKVLPSTSPAWAACAWHAATLACWVCCYRPITLFARSLCVPSVSSPSCPSLAQSQWIRAQGTVETVTWVLPQAVKRWWKDDQTPWASQEKDWLY